MKRKFLVSCLFLIAFTSGWTQKPTELLNAWSAKSPIEKVYLHFDRENYIAGETAWFKAYLYSDYQPDTISTTLYAELLDDKGEVLSRSVMPVLFGTSSGYFQLPDSLMAGSYVLRAYTPTMLNHDAAFIYKRSIFIYGKKAKTTPATKQQLTRLEFFPEGGNFVAGLNNAIAFKATNEKGLPEVVNGVIFNELNESLTSFSTYHDGMGMFEIMPTATGKYYAVVNGDTSKTKYYLPQQAEKGIAITIIPHPQGSFFELKQRQGDPAFEVAYMIGQMQHHVVFRQDFKTFKSELQGVINTKNLHSGILQVTFFNRNDQPLAERLCFVDNREYIQVGELVSDTISFIEKGRNRISIRLKDTVQGSFSVSITDPEYQLQPAREQNIYTGLLLTSDIKGYVHNPAYYFASDNDSVKTALDLVMMTNGWRRFRWTELSTNRLQNYKDASFITLGGRVTVRDTKRPFAQKPLLLMLITADSTRTMQMINTNALGDFRLDSMMFFGRSNVLISDIRGKKNEFIDINFSADSLTRRFPLPLIEKHPLVLPGDAFTASNSKTDRDYDEIMKAKGVMLQGVTVKAKKKSPVEALEEKYATGMFSGGDNRTFDLVNNPDAVTYATIFDFLQLQIPSLVVADDGLGSINLFYRQSGGASMSSLGPIPMVLYLDEVETAGEVIATVPANQVAMVKLFSNFVGAVGGGAGGALAIYTKKGSDMNVMTHAADIEKYSGYTVVKEFYEPDYKVDKSALNKPDNRITLSWRSDILINNVDPRIPVSFYNNDRTKSFRIVVEGMTLDGKMLMIEKTISTKGF